MMTSTIQRFTHKPLITFMLDKWLPLRLLINQSLQTAATLNELSVF